MRKQVYSAIPGLFVYPDHFPRPQCAGLVREALELYARLEEAAARAAKVEHPHDPPPGFVRSARHNLPSEEFYTPVVLEQVNQRRLSCEYFPRYGEEGRALCYFRGEANLPDFVRDGLRAPTGRTIEKAGLARPGQDLTWKLTMNFYRNVGGNVAGFPFHVDVPANGVVTAILNVQREVLFQIAPTTPAAGDEAITDIRLPAGGLLVLSGAIRYEWKHRVLPMAGGAVAPPGGVERVSLVLGFQ